MKCGAKWFHFDDLDLVFVSLKNQNLYGETKKDVGIVFYLALKYINGV